MISAELLRALAERAGYRVLRVAGTDTTCTAAIVVAATGVELGRSTYTMDDAARAGDANKDNYKRHPGRMLWARASAHAVLTFAPAVSLGLLVTEEVADIPPPEPEPADEGIEFPTPTSPTWTASRSPRRNSRPPTNLGRSRCRGGSRSPCSCSASCSA